MKRVTTTIIALSSMFATSIATADGWDPNTAAGNQVGNGIADTRHNMTMRYPGGADVSGFMNTARNDYGEVCVYCHTPHGAETSTNMPLWNRTTLSTRTFDLWNRPTSLGTFQEVTAPGAPSLTCLSCHDGVTAIDSIINMPGSGGYQASQTSSVDSGFLDGWSGPGGTSGHATLQECTDACHGAPSGPFDGPDFNAFIIGTDLTNDHPVGVKFPQTFGVGVDFNDTDVKIPGKYAFFDLDGDGNADKDEIRVYDNDGGGNYEVECASCHDPHGVPGEGGEFIPSFLRVSNDGSNLCFACHIK